MFRSCCHFTRERERGHRFASRLPSPDNPGRERGVNDSEQNLGPETKVVHLASLFPVLYEEPEHHGVQEGQN